jgi:hypothetical protein
LPDVFLGRNLTIGFLLDAKRTGRLHPSTKPLKAIDVHEMRIRLGVAQRELARPTTVSCAARSRPLVLHPAKGDRFRIGSPIEMTTVGPGGARTSRRVAFVPPNGQELTIELDHLALRVTPTPSERSFVLCER